MGDIMGIKISGVGCSLLDLIYSDVDFQSQAFRRLSSQKPGDGGLVPGGLVFVDDLERFANTDFKTIVKTITGKSSPDAMNLGGLAAIYAGGVYAESRAGEKYRWLKSYVDQYRQQIDDLAGYSRP